MSTHKTFIEEEIIVSFLNETFPKGISNFEVIKGGQGSQAFGFSVLDDNYIIRINKNSSEGFEKDRYAFTHFSSPTLPIPEVYKIGILNNGLHFCISKRAPGKILDMYTDEEKKTLAPELFAILDAIHAVDISNVKGYGEWDSNGQAREKSWNEHLLTPDYRVVRSDGGPGLFETSFLEKDFSDKVSDKVAGLVQYCPRDRFLLHSDCGFDNILSDGKKITGVIDWENSMYGDFLFDIAWLSFWWSEIGYESMYKKYAKDKDRRIEHFNERMLCYKLNIGLGAMIFFAYSDQKDMYDYTKGIVEKLL